MDIFKSKGRFAQRGTKHVNKPTTHQERTQEIAPFLFAYNPKGKNKLQTKQERKDKEENKQRRADTETQGQKDKSRSKEIKRKAKG